MPFLPVLENTTFLRNNWGDRQDYEHTLIGNFRKVNIRQKNSPAGLIRLPDLHFTCG
jgi:hypothetical protein